MKTMTVLESNERLVFRGEDLAAAIAELSSIVVSLHRIGAQYAVSKDREEYQAETVRYVDEWRVTQRLAAATAVLGAPFDRSLGPDDMDDLERAAESADYWDGPGSKPSSPMQGEADLKD
jgi:hypothetical protein